MFSKHRIEALSDAVFAIAMTLLILEIKVPVDLAGESLGHALKHDVHQWISFVITFALTSLYWTFQHKVFEELDEVNHGSLVITFVFLGFVTVLPFSTALWGHHINMPVAYMIYFLNQFLIAGALTLKVERARVTGHLRAGLGSAILRMRLFFLCGLLGACTVACMLVPIRYLVLVMLPIALVGRAVRMRHKRRLARAEHDETSVIQHVHR